MTNNNVYIMAGVNKITAEAKKLIGEITKAKTKEFLDERLEFLGITNINSQKKEKSKRNIKEIFFNITKNRTNRKSNAEESSKAEEAAKKAEEAKAKAEEAKKAEEEAKAKAEEEARAKAEEAKRKNAENEDNPQENATV